MNQAALTALRMRARTGLLANSMEHKRDVHRAECNHNFWLGMAHAVACLEEGHATHMADRDETLGGYQLPRFLDRAAETLGNDIYTLSRVEVMKRLAAAGIQITGHAVAGLDVGATQDLEDAAVSAVNLDANDAAPPVDQENRSVLHGHPPKVGENTIVAVEGGAA